MRTLIISTLLLLSGLLRAQDTEIAKLKAQLEAHPQRDTTRLGLLFDYIVKIKELDASLFELHTDEAISIAKELGNQRYLGLSYNYKVLFLSMQGQYPEAITMAKTAEQLLLQYGKPADLLDTYNYLAIIYRSIEKTPQALQMFFKVEKMLIDNSIKDPMEYTRIHANIGSCYYDMYKDDSAAYHHTKAHEYSILTEDPYSIGRTALSLSSVLLEQHQFDKALVYINKALSISKKNQLTDNVYGAYQNLGLCYLYQKQYPLAVVYYDSALVYLKSINDYNAGLGEAYQSKAQVQEAMGDYKGAIVTYKEFLSFKDSFAMVTQKETTMELEAKYDNQKKAAEIKDLAQQNRIKSLQNWGLIGGFILLGLLAYFLFSRYKTKKQNELLLMELEQTQKTITAERKAAESELKALKSQMNPHFIFNALNSIQEQFMYGDKFKANDQMGNFTYLTRKILDVSGKKLITLATEVEILDKYLSLEKMRFGDEFVYTISHSDTLDEDYNQIPPMLIQPFAENSIKHGLLHRVGAKRLDIHFDLDEAEAYLICIITDNGVGRGKSALIKAKNQNQHQSFSTQSINERLAILSTDPSKELVQYTDLYDEQGEPSGTKVQVYIPLG